jgi:hypothetical protein
MPGAHDAVEARRRNPPCTSTTAHSFAEEEAEMTPEVETEFLVEDDEEALIHEWRAEQLTKLGVSTIVAQAVASFVDWHELARLIERGCSPELALEIVR